MKKFIILNMRLYFKIIIISLLLLPFSAFATNGFFLHGYGSKNKAMGGAGVAFPQDSMANATNPAGMVHVGNNYNFGAAFLVGILDYQSSPSNLNGNGGAFTIGPNDIDSERDFFLIPHASLNYMLNDTSSIGASIYGHGGLNTHWRGGTATFDPDGPGPAPVGTFPGTFGDGTAASDLNQLFINFTYSQKVNDNFSFGLGPIIGIQSIRLEGLGNFAAFTETFNRSGGTQMPENLTDNKREYSYGYGAKIGALWDVNDTLSLGAAFQSRIYMDKFDDYSDLFPNNGEVDIPENMTLGFAIKPAEKITFLFDFQKIWYSNVDAIGNKFGNIQNCPAFGGTDFESCLGGDRSPGFGWNDMEIYKFGMQYDLNNNWTLRAGYSDTNQPIDDSEILFNLLSPAVLEEHYTAGLSRQIGEDSELSTSFLWAPKSRKNAANPLDPTQTIQYTPRMYELELSYSKRF